MPSVSLTIITILLRIAALTKQSQKGEIAVDAMALTDDAFLGGKLQLVQPAQGYRAGIDPVLLAAAIDAKPGANVLDLGCGVGAALFCFGARVPDCALTGVELQERYADLARENASRNGISATIHTANLLSLPEAVRAQSFDIVLANPPYFKPSQQQLEQGTERLYARHILSASVSQWIEAAARRLRPKGWLYLILRIERLPEAMIALDHHQLGAITILPIAGRIARDAHLVLIRAQRLGRGAFSISPFLILHEGLHHEKDGADFRREVEAILRLGAPLDMSAPP